ncbi:MAG TPA: aminotransferase class IV, partial [Opitutales bacterium]|nr:aminotransferase class IV [Opitutales bacterium]
MSSLEIIPPGAPLRLSPESSGFAHGFGLFETMRLRGGRIESWEAHWRRLSASAETLGLACPFQAREVLDAVKALARQLPAEATVKLSLLREGASSRLLVYTRPLNALPEKIGLLMEAPCRIDESSPLAGHK